MDGIEVQILSVNVGGPRPLGRVRGQVVHSGIAKRPVAPGTELALSTVNLAGDDQADRTVHGGPDKAVYAYPTEHWPVWEAEVGQAFGPSSFGENLSTAGVLEDDVRIGDEWTWGEARLQVCQPRSPCFKLALHLGRPDVNRRLSAEGRTGWYLRVLVPGVVRVGADVPIVVDRRPDHGVTVFDANRAVFDRAAAAGDLEAVLDAPELADEWRFAVEKRLARRPA